VPDIWRVGAEHIRKSRPRSACSDRNSAHSGNRKRLVPAFLRKRRESGRIEAQNPPGSAASKIQPNAQAQGASQLSQIMDRVKETAPN